MIKIRRCHITILSISWPSFHYHVNPIHGKMVFILRWCPGHLAYSYFIFFTPSVFLILVLVSTRGWGMLNTWPPIDGNIERVFHIKQPSDMMKKINFYNVYCTQNNDSDDFVHWNSFHFPKSHLHIDGLVQERRNSIANAPELCFSCISPSIYAIKLDMSTARRRLKSPQSLSGTSAHMVRLVNIMVMNGWLTSFRSMSIGRPNPEIKQTLTLKFQLQGQGHGCGQRARSYNRPSIILTHLVFISHQSDQQFLR